MNEKVIRAMDATVTAMARVDDPTEKTAILLSDARDYFGPHVAMKHITLPQTVAALLQLAADANLIEDNDASGWLFESIEKRIKAGMRKFQQAGDPLVLAYAADSLFGPFVLWQQTLHLWDEGAWIACDSTRENRIVYDLAEKRPGFTARPHSVKAVLQAIEAKVATRADDEVPLWLDVDKIRPDPRWMIACPNKLINAAAKTTQKPSKKLFTPWALTTEWESRPAPPVAFIAFLEQTGMTKGEVRVLQEFLGYCLVPNNDMQKFLIIKGPPGSGKGTLMRVLKTILGRAAGTTTFGQLASGFGLASIAQKSVVTVDDAHMPTKIDTAELMTRILSITGRDELPVDRKYKDVIDSALIVRFIICTNELMRFRDASGAFARRSMIIEFRKSHVGAENYNLDETLAAEGPGILRWAYRGLCRLIERGHFVQSRHGQHVLNEMLALTSPVKPFLNEMCHIAPDASISANALYTAYRDWAIENGYPTMNSGVFGKMLNEAVPSMNKRRARKKTGRTSVYTGIQLRG